MSELDVEGVWSSDELHETPVTARARVKRVATLLIRAEQGLKRTREAELNAEHDYDAAKRRAQMAANAPKVERGGATVADKAAWVEEACADQQQAFKLAEMQRQAAQDHYRRVDTQAMLSQSILKSIDRAFSQGLRDDA